MIFDLHSRQFRISVDTVGWEESANLNLYSQIRWCDARYQHEEPMHFTEITKRWKTTISHLCFLPNEIDYDTSWRKYVSFDENDENRIHNEDTAQNLWNHADFLVEFTYFMPVFTARHLTLAFMPTIGYQS